MKERNYMKKLIKLCSEFTNDIVARVICILLSRFSYDFTYEQRDRIQDILSENQPI